MALRDWLEERAADVNIFDGGRTAATVRRERAKAPPAQTVRRPQNTLTNNALTRNVKSSFNSAPSIANPLGVVGLGGKLLQNVSSRIPKNPLPETNPVTRFANKQIIQPYKQTTGNAGQLFQGRNPYTGNTKQQLGQFGQDAINVASVAPIGGAANLVVRGGRVLPRVVQGAKSGLKVGAGFGAAQGTADALKQNQNLPQAARTIATSTVIGGALGGGTGGALPLAGSAVRAAAPVVKRGAQNTARAAQQANERVFTPRVNIEDQNILRDYSDLVHGAYNPQGAELSNLIAKARQVGAKYGVNLANGSVEDRRQAVNAVLDRVGQSGRQVSQGGYAKIPSGDRDPAPDLSPEQKEFINDYAEMLKSMGEGNGVDILPDGTRVSNNFRSAENKGKRMNNADWFDQARQEIEGGRGAYGASDEYALLPKLDTRSPIKRAADEVRAKNGGGLVSNQKEILERTKQIVVEQERGLRPDAEARVFAQNPIQPKAPKPELPEELPVYSTKKVGNIDKIFRSTRSIIERQGEAGKTLASMLQGARDTQELYLGALQKQMPTVRKLKGKDYENFVEATQGLAKPKNAKIAQAIKEWQAIHPQIRDRAVAAGLDVGDLGPGYYPHFIDYDRIFKDKNTYNEAINHLVKTGQAQTPEEAIKLLGFARDVSRNREFGNLEASRIVDLPMYDKTPNSLISYLNGSAKRIAQTETFGAKDEKALDLIKQIGLQGGDTEAAKNAYDVAVGAKQYNPTSSKISQNIRRYITTTRLGLGALTNVSQNVNTGIVTGHMRTLASAFKQLDPKTRAFVGDTGVIADAVLNDIRTQSGYASFGERAAGKVIDKITAPFFGTVEKVNRSISATAGRDYGLRLAQKGDIPTLRKLGVTGEIRNKTLTPEQQIQVARKIVEKTQFKVDPQDLPGWADSPGGKLVAQFRTFSYNQGKFISNEVLKPAAKGDLMPLARLLAALPLGYALYETKRVIAGRPEEENKTKVGLAAFQNVGGAGLAFDLYQSLNPIGSQYLPPDRRTTMAVGALGGPAAGVTAQGIGAISEAVQRKNTPTDETRLDGKVVAGNTGETYTDLTAVSRFGIQQVPIVGTAIKNRVLPYKRESDADTGKTDNVAVNDAVKAAEEAERASIEALRTGLTEDENALRKLSKQERQYLIDGGTVSEERFRKIDAKAEGIKDKFGLGTKKDVIKLKNDSRGTALLDKVGTMTSDQRKEWETQDLDPAYKDVFDRAQKIRFEGLPDLPQNNKVLGLYADLLEKRSKGMSKLSENKAKLTFLKEAYRSELPKETLEVFGASTNEILEGVNQGLISEEQVRLAVQFDNFMVEKKLANSADIPKKVREELGLGLAPGMKGSSGKRGGRGGSSEYSLYGLANPISFNRSLRNLVDQARL